ncbi:MAG: hypothetical protein APR54_08415 [Candidatus Cloacimonas sp. SDB]|nr:MAG: hypothetical protein APR54_08415 [Candidatus Cloacimonas sp. SDB]
MYDIFSQNYSELYDSLYFDKNYENECDLIEQIINDYSSKKSKNILDLGCGTGNHSIRLARRGYKVTGIDKSLNMLDIAKNKLKNENIPVEFLHSDIRNYSLNQKYDIVLMMFAVLSYQITNDDLIKTLQNVREHLDENGILIADLWYGPAVLNLRPENRLKIFDHDDQKIVRISSGRLNLIEQTCEIRINLWKIQGSKIINEIEEKHTMRYFFPQELQLLFHFCDLKLIKIGKFPEFNIIPDENSWNCTIIAKPLKNSR